MTDAGFVELTHTADWSIRVWASDLPGLFTEAARGMNLLSGMHLKEGPRKFIYLELQAPDEEGLLVEFLSELVFYAEQENFGFDQFEFEITATTLKAKMTGAPLESMTKAIKAVTFHNLSIRKTDQGVEVEIVFDV